jgi:hypothetical protein
MTDEIERLQSELDKAHRLLSQMLGWQRDAEIVKAKQAQEIERLRAALARLVTDYEDVPDPTDDDGQAVFQRAREALGGASERLGNG